MVLLHSYGTASEEGAAMVLQWSGRWNSTALTLRLSRRALAAIALHGLVIFLKCLWRCMDLLFFWHACGAAMALLHLALPMKKTGYSLNNQRNFTKFLWYAYLIHTI
jgi:hypothetical protein